MACLLNLPQCLIYSIPWPVWAVLALIVAGIVLRLFGWRWAVTAAAALGAAVLLDRARQQGYSDRKAQEKQAEDKAAKTVEQERTRTEALPDDKLNSEVDKWTRK